MLYGLMTSKGITRNTFYITINNLKEKGYLKNYWDWTKPQVPEYLKYGEKSSSNPKEYWRQNYG